MVASVTQATGSAVLCVDLTKKLVSRAGTFDLDVAFSVGAEITVMFGMSGAGKTTVLECIAGLMQPDSERVLLNGTDLTRLPARERRIGYVFQELALFPHLTARENIGYGLRTLPEREKKQRIGEIIESFHIAHASDRKPRAMSGGERQRVALARSLVIQPCMLLLDEPMSALDHGTKAAILRDLREYHTQHRIPVIYVTHALDEVFAIADRVLKIANGKIVAEGKPEEVLSEEREQLIQYLNAAR